MDFLKKLNRSEKNDFSSFVENVLAQKYKAAVDTFNEELEKDETEESESEDSEEDSVDLDEARVKKIVFRNGKKKKIFKSTRKNTKIVNGREVMQKSKERINRKNATKKTARKTKNRSASKLKRARTMKKRNKLNI